MFTYNKIVAFLFFVSFAQLSPLIGMNKKDNKWYGKYIPETPGAEDQKPMFSKNFHISLAVTMLRKCNKKCRLSPFTNCIQECMTQYSKQVDHFFIREFTKICSNKGKTSEDFILFDDEDNENDNEFTKERAEQMMETVEAYKTIDLNKAIGLCVQKKQITELSYMNKLAQRKRS